MKPSKKKFNKDGPLDGLVKIDYRTLTDNPHKVG